MVLMPSLKEGLPNVAVEAAAVGRAVIASAVGGIPEVVVNGETGLLFRPDDHNAFAEAMIAAAHDKNALDRLGRQARIRAETIFDARLFAPRMADVYRSALVVPLGRP